MSGSLDDKPADEWRAFLPWPVPFAQRPGLKQIRSNLEFLRYRIREKGACRGDLASDVAAVGDPGDEARA